MFIGFHQGVLQTKRILARSGPSDSMTTLFTADHGVSFTPSAAAESSTWQHPAEERRTWLGVGMSFVNRFQTASPSISVPMAGQRYAEGGPWSAPRK